MLFRSYGAILATPVADTLKHSCAQDAGLPTYVAQTLDRSNIWQAQTPQVFRLGELQRVLTYVAENQLEITDEASAFEHLELPIRLVSGSRQNIKLTYPDDAILLAAILTAQSELS